MKKVLLIIAVAISVGAKAQSVGSFYNVDMTTQKTSATWGFWISGKKFGIEHSNSAVVNTDMSNAYIYDNFFYRTSKSYGVTYLFPTKDIEHLNVVVGGGIQNIYTEKWNERGGTSWQRDFLPYASLAFEYELNSVFNVRGRVEFGKIQIIGGGIGIKLGNY